MSVCSFFPFQVSGHIWKLHTSVASEMIHQFSCHIPGILPVCLKIGSSKIWCSITMFIYFPIFPEGMLHFQTHPKTSWCKAISQEGMVRNLQHVDMWWVCFLTCGDNPERFIESHRMMISPSVATSTKSIASRGLTLDDAAARYAYCMSQSWHLPSPVWHFRRSHPQAVPLCHAWVKPVMSEHWFHPSKGNQDKGHKMWFPQIGVPPNHPS